MTMTASEARRQRVDAIHQTGREMQAMREARATEKRAARIATQQRREHEAAMRATQPMTAGEPSASDDAANRIAKRPVSRPHTCMCCNRPRTARRKATRCTECSATYQHYRRNGYSNPTGRTEADMRERLTATGEYVPKAPTPSNAKWYDNDSDIARYRAEKARVTKRDIGSAESVDVAIAEARAILQAEAGDRLRAKRSA